MNYTTIMGHLGADPEVRFTSSGQKVTTFRVATNQRRSGKEDTTWWRVTVWGEQFDRMMPYLKKGSSIIVMGEMSKPEIYTDREGRPQISLNVTASHISFSPFGRGGQREQGEGFMGQSGMSGGREGGASFGEEDKSDQMMQGQGDPSLEEVAALSDEEIPF
jgi:single-strand DNA-binding protein